MRPITVQPGYTENDVTSAMSSGQYVYADCFTIIPKVGDPLRYTTAQQSVSVVPVDGLIRVTYTTEVLIKGLKLKSSLGTEVDEQDITIFYPDTPVYQGYLTWAQALLLGRLDGASVRRDRFIASSWGSPWLGGFPIFVGLVSSLDKVGRQAASLKVKSDLILLDRQSPRDLWETNCKNTWGDVGCGINQADWAVAGTIDSGTTQSVINWAPADSEYALGKIHIAGGDSVTRVRTVSRTSSGQLYLSYPLDFLPSPGDPFVAYPGCDRTKDRCPHFWGGEWVNHYKGFPFVPVAETAS